VQHYYFTLVCTLYSYNLIGRRKIVIWNNEYKVYRYYGWRRLIILTKLSPRHSQVHYQGRHSDSRNNEGCMLGGSSTNQDAETAPFAVRAIWTGVRFAASYRKGRDRCEKQLSFAAADESQMFCKPRQAGSAFSQDCYLFRLVVSLTWRTLRFSQNTEYQVESRNRPIPYRTLIS
jgi:hypothetical protein